jgi:hypothetical protein
MRHIGKCLSLNVCIFAISHIIDLKAMQIYNDLPSYN